MKVLLVDDDPEIRLIARFALERAPDVEVLEAQDGATALDIAIRERVDVILLDRFLPDLDGPEVLERLRRDERTRSVPVVFLTGVTRESELDELRSLGARGAIAKPFDPRHLLGTVRALLDSRA
ncbi:MAG: response regulator [Planctomycetes bacterium]|nr:response regulator [Planctomycetota bacterium]